MRKPRSSRKNSSQSSARVGDVVATRTAEVVAAPAGLLRPVWKHVAVTVRGGDATNPGEMVLYEDGVRVATNGELTLTQARVNYIRDGISDPSEVGTRWRSQEFDRE